MEQDTLYQRQVIDRARAPAHAGSLDGATHTGEGTNPMCGDRVRVGLSLTKGGTVTAVRHETRGCAICIASADMMAGLAEGRSALELGALSRQFGEMLRTGEGAEQVGELGVFAPLHQHRSRIRCATLPWTALVEALDGSKDR
ncbi:SUF system NifU family Fe-S cluster assembly protein [Gluconacetobacter azotocaptans]|uniref:SUF system NifU family Fe-S cluster assembly protein n=1 Tax=Gluconacetobacter azotocaptans TaxID=142834 RepID=A0A7W4PEC3_9PROT|nr:SUF system NifU family Fe-S cluster assembly protein [Gluconacetobacter azotocaptans]MBB2191187.1 SUF system NifU family Fe-S cluster assembly protein [Gluconacetobacter azotocaptans]GBQ36558.1 NifU family SUF system FeS assembly protein [Gluconacetobacter azotocaptans DSM 13594]